MSKKENWAGYEAPTFAAVNKRAAAGAAPTSAADKKKKPKFNSKSSSGHAGGMKLENWFRPLNSSV